jgi:hypothetical protein
MGSRLRGNDVPGPRANAYAAGIILLVPASIQSANNTGISCERLRSARRAPS